MNGMIGKYDILTGDVVEQLATLGDQHFHCVVTSPPYWGLRSYLPDAVVVKKDAPKWLEKKLADMKIFPI